jgi:adenine-specific DNA-methyltransferase
MATHRHSGVHGTSRSINGGAQAPPFLLWKAESKDAIHQEHIENTMPQARRRTKARQDTLELAFPIPQPVRLKRDSDALMVCQDNEAFLEALAPESIQLIVTSPPYNIGKAYESKSPLTRYLDGQAKVIEQCVRLLKPGGSICWQVGNHIQKGEIVPLDIVLYPLFKQRGLELRNRIIWHFEHGLHCSKRLSGRHETILWFTKGSDYTFGLDPIRVPSKYPGKKHFKGPKAGQLSGNPLGKNPGDVWIFPNVKSNHVEKTVHPCQFPVELVERLVLSLTKRNDIVLDPYMGVGSSVVAALKNGRRGYGCDVVQEYVDVAWERVHELRAGRLRTRPMDRPVYDPTKKNGGQR